MKVRNGFVSNSSSSSFCIYGESYDVEELIKKMKDTKFFNENDEERLEEMKSNFDWCGIEDIISEKTLLEVYYSSDSIWIGRSWERIGDNETGKEFKYRVEQELQDIVGANIYCTTHTEVIY